MIVQDAAGRSSLLPACITYAIATNSQAAIDTTINNAASTSAWPSRVNLDSGKLHNAEARYRQLDVAMVNRNFTQYRYEDFLFLGDDHELEDGPSIETVKSNDYLTRIEIILCLYSCLLEIGA